MVVVVFNVFNLDALPFLSVVIRCVSSVAKFDSKGKCLAGGVSCLFGDPLVCVNNFFIFDVVLTVVCLICDFFGTGQK